MGIKLISYFCASKMQEVAFEPDILTIKYTFTYEFHSQKTNPKYVHVAILGVVLDFHD
jgi:hypothetical protein